MVSRKKAFRLYMMALKAFQRLHGYAADTGKIEHQKFMCGWQQGYLAAERRIRST